MLLLLPSPSWRRAWALVIIMPVSRPRLVCFSGEADSAPEEGPTVKVDHGDSTYPFAHSLADSSS